MLVYAWVDLPLAWGCAGPSAYRCLPPRSVMAAPRSGTRQRVRAYSLETAREIALEIGALGSEPPHPPRC